jgi:hypothetical protein
MTKIKHFEEIELDKVSEYYDTELVIGGKAISVDLNFDNTTISEELAGRINLFIDKISVFNEQFLQAIHNDYLTGDTVKLYVEHHLDIFEDEDAMASLEIADTSKSKTEQLLSLIHLKRVGLYPENDTHFATVDYTIGDEVTQYLIVVVVHENGDIEYITMES